MISRLFRVVLILGGAPVVGVVASVVVATVFGTELSFALNFSIVVFSYSSFLAS